MIPVLETEYISPAQSRLPKARNSIVGVTIVVTSQLIEVAQVSRTR